MENQNNNPLASIPDNKLTFEYWQKSKAQAEAEKAWQIKDHSRLIVLSELTNHYASGGDSIASAERKARTSPEYQEFINELGECRSELVLARAKTAALEHEIRLRINRSFQERAEYQGGHLNT